jgi:hypothetical protein
LKWGWPVTSQPLKLCLDRIAPARKETPISLEMPRLADAASAAAATATIAEAAANGEIETGQAATLSTLVNNFTRALEVSELAARIDALEKAAK